MAGKKKKPIERQQRQQKKQLRRKQRRPQTTSRPVTPTPDVGFDNIPLGHSPQLLRDFGSGDIVAVLEVASETEDLLEEPEFDEIEVDPIAAATAFVTSAEGLGRSPEDLSSSEEMQEILAEAIQVLLTPTLRQEIGQAASVLRDRSRAAGDQALLKKAAAIQFLVQEEALDTALPLVGLLRQLVSNGIDAGFALIDISRKIEEAKPGEDALAADGEEPGENAALATLIAQTLADTPALRRYLKKQADTTFEEGRAAIFSGALVLDLYSAAELHAVAQEVLALWTEEAPEKEVASSAADEVRMGQVTAILDTFIEQLFTKERLADTRRQLEMLLDSPQYYESKWTPFLKLEHAAFGSDDALDAERPLLAAALWAEIKPYLLDAELRNRHTETADSTVVAEESA